MTKDTSPTTPKGRWRRAHPPKPVRSRDKTKCLYRHEGGNGTICTNDKSPNTFRLYLLPNNGADVCKNCVCMSWGMRRAQSNGSGDTDE